MRTEDTLKALEDALLANFGDFFGACKTVGVSPAFVRKWQKDDPLVGERISSASQCGALGLESAAIQRAVHGVEKPVFYKGEECGTVIEYSDPLLQTLLKKRIPEVYGDTDNARNIINAGVINIMPRANTYEEWLGMVDITNTPKQLPAPEVEDAEFTAALPAPEEDPCMADLL